MVDLEQSVHNYEAGSQVVPYSISLEEFQGTPPSNPKQYNLSERVTRETFLSLFIDSFTKSRGSPDAQQTFMNWFMENNGLDYGKTFDNFQSAGYWNCLSKQEQEMFLSRFHNVQKHGFMDDKDIVIEFKYFVEGFTSQGILEYQSIGKKHAIPLDEPLKGMSLQRLIEIIDLYRMTWD